MKITLPISALRKANKEEAELFRNKYSNSYQYSEIIADRKQYPDNHRLSYQLNEFSESQLSILISFTKRIGIDTRTSNSITMWHNAISNPLDAPVASIAALKNMLLQVFENNKYKWLFREEKDGSVLPYLITDVEYIPKSKYSVENVTISMGYGSYYSSEEFNEEDKAQYETTSESFYYNNIINIPKTSPDKKQIPDAAFIYNFDELNDDDDEDADDDVPKKKEKATVTIVDKSVRKKLLQVLADSNLFLPTEEWMNDFFKHSQLCYDLSSKTGKQYICTGKATSVSGWSSSVKPMSEDGSYYRLVIDMKGIPAGAERQHSAIFGEGLIPYHPYIRCYNLTKYDFCDVHAAFLQPYKYDDKIIDNMIVADELKEYLNMILGGNNIFTDIVKGKSGGMIVLASGEPGVGKTLTAEVYSEKMELPLYSIQASQLGISLETIETKLVKALKRTERWGAVLLIDECDTYLRKRNNDIEQNAIVGIWLRLLEYFGGIMFLTTNMHDSIDDAILSRCSSHIKYEKPSKENLALIIMVHCRIQGIDVKPEEARRIAAEYNMTGRDVRNLLKNIKKCYHDGSKRIQLNKQMVEKIKQFIPFINN